MGGLTMQQLTLQFEGYADSRPAIDVSTTKPCSKVSICSQAGNKTFPHWEQSIPTLGIKSCILAACREALAKTALFAQATLCVVFCFALMFLAAIIQG